MKTTNFVISPIFNLKMKRLIPENKKTHLLTHICCEYVSTYVFTVFFLVSKQQPSKIYN